MTFEPASPINGRVGNNAQNIVACHFLFAAFNYQTTSFAQSPWKGGKTKFVIFFGTAVHSSVGRGFSPRGFRPLSRIKSLTKR